MKYFILLSIVCFSLVGSAALACTGFVLQDGERVLVGNNEDWFNPRSKIWFVQPVNDRYGSVFFGFDDFWPQGGMNQKGLFFDAFALKPKTVEETVTKPRYKGNLIKEVMATCGTVENALEMIDRYSLYFMTRFQLFIADATGDSAIIEGNAVIRKKGNYQVVTNFRQSETDPSEALCPRYRIARDLLADCGDDKMHCVKSILAATHQEGPFCTQYSNIYDLNARRVYVYHFHNFQNEVVIDLEKELERKPGVIDLPDLFPTNYAAQSFVSRYTSLKKKYTHDDPHFLVRYPEVYETGEPLDSSQVFLARCRYGRVPVLTVSVSPAGIEIPLSRVGNEFYAPRLLKFGNHVKILSNSSTNLQDGSEAYETRIAWKFDGKTKLTSLVVSIIRENKLINVALHHNGDLDYLKHIPYSLHFE
jgi:hypothetical protein